MGVGVDEVVAVGAVWVLGPQGLVLHCGVLQGVVGGVLEDLMAGLGRERLAPGTPGASTHHVRDGGAERVATCQGLRRPGRVKSDKSQKMQIFNFFCFII